MLATLLRELHDEEAHLDADSIFGGVQRFAQERPKRLARQRAQLDALG